ncbi:MAG: protein kinase [Elusimicrobia bacterium]|nr:protein kinase [Elusimicrobiota bacterium]
MTLSAKPAELLSLVRTRYGINPDPNVIADLGEGDHAEVRRGAFPKTSPISRALFSPGEPVAVKIPYLDPGGMMAHEADVSRRLAAAGGSEIFVRAAHDAELGVLVMESLERYKTLDEWAEGRRAIAPRTLERIASQLKRGLAVLEAAGLVHSDLKPENILIGPRGRIKIVDFGISADRSGYPPYPEYHGWRGGHHDFVSANQLSNGPAAYEDDRHAVRAVLRRLRYRAATAASRARK